MTGYTKYKRIKIAGCLPTRSIKEPQIVANLKTQSPFWDLQCLDCGMPTVRLLHVVSLCIHQQPASLLCNSCYAPHLVALVQKRADKFKVVVQRDYAPQDQLVITQVFKTQWKRRKFSSNEVGRVYAKGKGKCYLCQHKLKLAGYGKEWDVDHNIPLSRQGNNELRNLWPACYSCNRSKHNLTKREFKARNRKRNPDPKPYDPWSEF